MEPTLMNGDHVLTSVDRNISSMDIVVCRHPFVTNQIIIKRVVDADSDGMVLMGDNPSASTDSQTFGKVPWAHLVAKVTSKM